MRLTWLKCWLGGGAMGGGVLNSPLEARAAAAAACAWIQGVREHNRSSEGCQPLRTGWSRTWKSSVSSGLREGGGAESWPEPRML